MNQILINAVVSAAGYLLVGIGFSLIYTSTRFFHFAHGIVITVGAYMAFALKSWAGLSLPASMCGGILASMLLGAGMEWSIYRPLRARGTSATTLLLASLGFYIALQGLISMIFGSGNQTLRSGEVPEGLLFLGARITVPQIGIIITGIGGCLMIWLLLHRAQFGKMIRAVADDPDLAIVYGVNCDRVIMIVFLLGSALAGVAAILLAYDSDMTPMMGFHALLMGMVAVIIGGIGSIPGLALGAVFLGLIQHLTAWWISSRWQGALTFLILILFLLLRPQGFLGKPLRKVSV